MASELLNKYGNAISSFTLIPAGGGVFEVTKNESLLFSKMNKGRFPELDEIFELLENPV